MPLHLNKETGEIKGGLRIPRQQQNRVLDEELEYWRKRAGWFDDDVTMQEYNNGVSATFYDIDDDVTPRGSGRHNNGMGSHGKLIINIAAIVISISIAVLVYRFLTSRRSSPKVAPASTEKKRSSSTSKDDRGRRSRSKSVSGRSRSSRSKSRSRSDKDYVLMEDDTASRKSSRSRSSRRSRSRSGRKSSRSKSRSKRTEENMPREIQEVLV
jgi:hypothetical protein